MLESMNLIVAERMSFVDEYIQTFNLSDECKKRIYPVYTRGDPKVLGILL